MTREPPVTDLQAERLRRIKRHREVAALADPLARYRSVACACGHLTAAVRAMVPNASEAFIHYCLEQMLETIYEAHTARASGQLAD